MKLRKTIKSMEKINKEKQGKLSDYLAHFKLL